MEDFDNEHEIALDEALGRIRGDSNESDEDFFDLENTDVVVGRQYNVNNNHSNCVKLLCMPPRSNTRSVTTKLPQYHNLRREITVQNTQLETLTQTEFCRQLYQKLLTVQRDRVNMREQVKEMARKSGKSYSEIMSLDWYDSPKSIKYIDTRLTKLHPSCSIDSGLGYGSNQLSFTSDPLYYDTSSNYSNSEFFLPTQKMTSSSLSRYQGGIHPPSHYTLSSSSSHHSSSHSGPANYLVVAYTIDQKTFKTTIPVRHSFSLRDFKENVFFNRRGRYRFFFKTYCSELENVVFEEISGDMQTVPLFEGKIIAQIEQIIDTDS